VDSDKTNQRSEHSGDSDKTNQRSGHRGDSDKTNQRSYWNTWVILIKQIRRPLCVLSSDLFY
jgi:hypothetical protein